jgi:hypothetical protein
MPIPSANLSTAPAQNMSTQTPVPLANQASNEAESGRNMEGPIPQNQSQLNTAGEEPISDQGTPLSEAIEAISKLIGRNNGG